MRLPEVVLSLLRGPHAAAVATRDAEHRPDVRQGGFVRVAPDLENVTVFVVERGERDTSALLRESGRIAVTFNHPASNECYQLKGTITEVRPMTAIERAHQDVLHDQLLDVLAMMFPSELVAIARQLTYRPCVAVDVEVDAVFLQTPGPEAGKAVGPSPTPRAEAAR